MRSSNFGGGGSCIKSDKLYSCNFKRKQRMEMPNNVAAWVRLYLQSASVCKMWRRSTSAKLKTCSGNEGIWLINRPRIIHASVILEIELWSTEGERACTSGDCEEGQA